MAHQPLVDTIRQQQDLHALLAQRFDVGAILCSRMVLCHDVIDGLLIVLHRFDILLQGNPLSGFVVTRRSKAKQISNFLAISEVLRGTLFQHRAKGIPETGVIIGLLARYF